MGAQICFAFLFVLRDWGHFTMGSGTADRKRIYVKNILLRVLKGQGSGTSSPLSFSAYWAIFGPDPQRAGQALDQSCPLVPQLPHWSPPSSASQNASSDVPVALGAEETHPSVEEEVGLKYMVEKGKLPTSLGVTKLPKWLSGRVTWLVPGD